MVGLMKKKHMSSTERRIGVILRKRLYKEQDGYCAYCGKYMTSEEATLDHIIPFSHGGPTTDKNCVVCCRKCNELKANTPLKKVWFMIKSPRCFVKLSPFIGLRIMKGRE